MAPRISLVRPLTPRAELDAAGIEGAALRAGYARCRSLSARHGTAFFVATLLLPPAKRPFVHALLGLAVHAAELTDAPAADDRQRADRLAEWSRNLLADLDWGATSDPVARAALDTITRWAVPVGYVADFLDAVRADITDMSYSTWDDLARHLWGTAALPGLQLLPILGGVDDVRWDVLEAHAIDLATAFGLTVILRDVAADLRRGRLYLPQESLDQFGVDRDRLQRGRVDESIRNLLAWEIERARRLYAGAAPGIELVHPTSRDSVRTALRLHTAILDEIEHADYDVFGDRVRVGRARQAAVGLHGLRGSWSARRADRR